MSCCCTIYSRHALDGATTGPRGFSGSIGKWLQTCIEQLSNLDPKELSTDQRYLLEMCNSISKGECSVDLSMRNPGCLNYSQWLTTANRILRLYVSDKKPSENLKILVTFIICSGVKGKGKGLPYSIPSVGPGANPGVQAVSPQVTVSHPPSGRLPLLSARPAVTSPAA